MKRKKPPQGKELLRDRVYRQQIRDLVKWLRKTNKTVKDLPPIVMAMIDGQEILLDGLKRVQASIEMADDDIPYVIEPTVKTEAQAQRWRNAHLRQQLCDDFQKLVPNASTLDTMRFIGREFPHLSEGEI